MRPCQCRSVRVALVCLAALTIGYAAQVSLILIPRPSAGIYEKVATNLVFLGAALLCAWRAAHAGSERAPWACFAAGLGLWGLGDCTTPSRCGTSRSSRSRRPPTSATSGCIRARSPASYLLYRARGGRGGRSLWVDGAIGALALAALGSTLLYGPLTDALAAPTGSSRTCRIRWATCCCSRSSAAPSR